MPERSTKRHLGGRGVRSGGGCCWVKRNITVVKSRETKKGRDKIAEVFLI